MWLATFIAGLLLLVVTVLMGRSAPKPITVARGEVKSPVVAFEFVNTPEEAVSLLEKHRHQLSLFRTNIRLDLFFLLAYGLFLGSFGVALALDTQNFPFLFSTALSLLAAFFDYFENKQLMAILNHFEKGSSLKPFIPRLQLFTWFKWLLLTAALAHYYTFFFYLDWPLNIHYLLGGLGVVSLILAVTGFFLRKKADRRVINWYVNLLPLLIFGLFVFTVFQVFIV